MVMDPKSPHISNQRWDGQEWQDPALGCGFGVSFMDIEPGEEWAFRIWSKEDPLRPVALGKIAHLTQAETPWVDIIGAPSSQPEFKLSQQ